MPLGENLRANEDIDALFLDVFQHVLPSVLPAHAVPVYTDDSRLGEALRQYLFHSLRAMAKWRKILVAAFRASAGKALLVAAMMTAQFSFIEMDHEAAAAPMAWGDPSACSAP